MFATRLHWSNSPKAKKMWTGCSIINTAKHLYPYSSVNLTKPSICCHITCHSSKKICLCCYLGLIYETLLQLKSLNHVPNFTKTLVFIS